MKVQLFEVSPAGYRFRFHASCDIDVDQTRNLLDRSASWGAGFYVADSAGRVSVEEDCYAFVRMLDSSDVKPADLKAHTKSFASEAQGLVLRFNFGVAEVHYTGAVRL